MIISLVTPVYNTKASWLKECFNSIINQSFTDWEWIICNNASNFNTSEILQEYANKDSRIKLCMLPTNEGGYKGINEALKYSTGQYVALMDSDDTLAFNTLEIIYSALNEFYKPDVIYTDEWIMNETNEKILPFLKPDYDKNLLCFLHYWGHLTLYRSALIKRLGLRHCGGSYDYDLALRASEITSNVYHIPEMLYYYRTYSDSTSSLTREECMAGGLQTLQEHLDLVYPGLIATRNDPLYDVNFNISSDTFRMKYYLVNNIIPKSEIYPDHLLKNLFLIN